MECPVCFTEVTKFKVLSCSHFFCEKCISNLSFEKVVEQPENGLKDEASSGEAKEEEQKSAAIKCPNCRQDTFIPKEGLKSKFIGKFMCRNCDLEKSVDDFRLVFIS